MLVAKGMVRVFIPDISHKAKIYQYLKTLQGTAILVCFGYTKLRSRYYLNLGVKISHILLMLWGGKIINNNITENHPEVWKIKQEVLRTGID